jgi:hypothetical protein
MSFVDVVGGCAALYGAIGMAIGLFIGRRNGTGVADTITVWGAYGAIAGLLIGFVDYIVSAVFFRHVGGEQQ